MGAYNCSVRCFQAGDGADDELRAFAAHVEAVAAAVHAELQLIDPQSA